MANILKQPCDEAAMLATSSPSATLCGSWVLIATILASSMAFIDGTVVNVALPALQSAMGASVSAIQWVVESYALLLAALLLPGGSLGDIYGRRKAFSSGVALFCLASTWCGLASDVHQLIAARALQGAGAASPYTRQPCFDQCLIPRRRTRTGDWNLVWVDCNHSRRWPDLRWMVGPACRLALDLLY
jgi:MFS family permease